MSDLLASLVDRALDRAPVLQRREPTFFEPVPDAAFEGHSQFGKASSFREDEAIETAAAPAPRKSRNRYPSPGTDFSSIVAAPLPKPGERPQRRRPVPGRNEETEADIDRIERDRSPVAHAKQQPAPAVPHDDRSGRDLVQPVVKLPEIKVAPQKSIETIVEKRVEVAVFSERSQETPARIIEPARDQMSSTARSTREDDGARATHPLKAPVKPVELPREQAIIKPATQKQPEDRQGMTPFVQAVSRIESSRLRHQPAPPNIHVTIGRIEVRASTQAADKPKAARPAGPKLSLEDYLRSRSGGN